MSAAPVTAGALLGGAWNLLKAQPLLVLPLALLGAVFSGGGELTPFGSRATEQRFQNLPPEEVLPLVAALLGALLLFLVVMAVLYLIVAGTLWLVTVRAALTSLQTGTAADLGLAWNAVRPQLAPALLTIFLWALVIGVGFLLLAVPGFIALAGLFPLVAVVVAEGRKGGDALRRTWGLTRGHRGTFFLVFLAGIGVSFLGSMVAGWIPVVGPILSGAVSGAVSAWWAGTVAIFYHRLSAPAAPPLAAPSLA